MSGSRALLAALTCGVALMVAGADGRAQSTVNGFTLIPDLGLPAVDYGVDRSSYIGPASQRTLVQRPSSGLIRRDSAGTRYAAGHVIVKYRSSASFDIVKLDAGEDPVAMAQSFKARADVEYAQPDYLMHAMMVPNDPLYKELQWDMPMIDVERAWDIQPQAGSSIIVAVLDTGVAYANATIRTNISGFRDDQGHIYPALANQTIPYSAAPQLGPSSRFVAPRDFIYGTTTPLDFHGHGTHVSGTIGQLTNDGVGVAGVAFNVKIMPVKVICGEWDILFGVPEEQCGTDSQVAQGIRYAADNGAKVINMSIGRNGSPAPVVEDAMRYAVGKGVFISVAAGNEGDQGNPVEVIAEIAGRLPGAVAVAALDVFRNRAFYSTFGSFVELAAPGGGGGDQESGYIFQQTFHPDYSDTFDLPVSQYIAPRFDMFAYVGYAGTSMAAPHVSGVAAMLMQQGITDPAAVEAALEGTAVDLGARGRDNDTGFGLIDARNAIRGTGLAR